jgi:ubiquitin-protein ligase
LINALAITEMEPFLALTERPTIHAPFTPVHRLQFMGHFWKVKPGVRYTVVTADQVPPRKEHPNLQDDFVQVNAMAARPHTNANAGNRRSNLRTSRLLIEMRSIAAGGSHPKYDVYVSESDMSFWKVVMEGPEESPYSEGTFVLYIHADEGYPTFAPKARFITKIKHPNVNAHGRICHSILTRDWTSDIKMTTLIDSIYGLLLQPEHSDPVSTIATLGFHHDQVEFADEVRDHVSMYARKSREQWKKELLGEEDSEEDEDEEDEDVDEDMDGEE